MFPDNQEINNMITTLKANQEDLQTSEIKNSRITGFKKTINKSETNMPRIDANNNTFKTNTGANFKTNTNSKPMNYEEKSTFF
jgi:hypothetical protein